MPLASVDKALYNEVTFSARNKYMKTIEIDDELYQYIAGQTQKIGESASEILRRLLLGDDTATVVQAVEPAASAPASPVSSSIFDLINKQDLPAESSVVGRFLFILSALARRIKSSLIKCWILRAVTGCILAAVQKSCQRLAAAPTQNKFLILNFG
jgi:hypothetical protein